MRGTLDHAWRRWCVLWAGRSDGRSLALYRVAWGLAAILICLSDAERASTFDADGFRVPAFDFLVPVSEDLFDVLRLCGLAGGILAVVGIAPRLGASLVVLAQGYLLCSNLLHFRNHVYLLCLLGIILAVSPSAHASSAATLLTRFRWRTPPGTVPRWTTQAVKGQILVVYLWAVLNKLNGPFLSGWVMQGELPAALPGSPAGAVALHLSFYEGLMSLAQDSGAMTKLSWFIVAAEMALVVGLASVRYRRGAVVLGVLLHGGIMITMNVVSFGLLMVGSYPLFVWGRRSRLPAPSRAALRARARS